MFVWSFLFFSFFLKFLLVLLFLQAPISYLLMKSSICSDIHTDPPFYLPTLNKFILAPAYCKWAALLITKIFSCSGIFYWRFSIFNFHYYCFQKKNISCLVAWNTIKILIPKVGSLNRPSNFLLFSITVKSETNQPY